MPLFGNKTSYDVTLLQTTSKDALKRSALLVCGGDVKAATEVCDYFMKDMPNMPDYDPPTTSALTQAKDTALGVLGWIDGNQDKVLGYYNLLRTLMGKAGVSVPTAPADVPPIP